MGPEIDPPPPLPPPDEEPPDDDDRNLIRVDPDSLDPEMSEEFREQLHGMGSSPCELHGMDHLSRDPSCEYCKRALGPMHQHLNPAIADHTPTLSFDFSGPLPAAVTGARYLMVFVWRLQEVRLLRAFALERRTKENVLSCLQSVVADLNTLTGGLKATRDPSSLGSGKKNFYHIMSWNG